MTNREADNWLPPQQKNYAGKERHVGVELEFSGCEPQDIIQCITDCFSGDVHKESIFHYQITQSELGDFVLELDAAILQSLVQPGSDDKRDKAKDSLAESLLKFAAEQVVPWEVVAPPIKLSQLSRLNTLFRCLRKKGALGTRQAARYAFGLHLNPELPALDGKTLVRYMQAYLCLYDWLYAAEKIDMARKITPYIDHFAKDYILTVVDTDYQPDTEQFIRDYLHYNPTRNRSLDLLPLIAYIDEKWVEKLDDKALIKPRPTLHYRLPNCDIDNPEWDLSVPWGLWLKVEQLASNAALLARFINEYRKYYQRLTHAIDNKWLSRCNELLDEL